MEKEVKGTLEERIKAFEEAVRMKAIGKYNDEMVDEFLDYWTEYNEGGRKFRAETQKIFNIGRRLATWSRNSKKFFKKPEPLTKKEVDEKLKGFKERYGLQ